MVKLRSNVVLCLLWKPERWECNVGLVAMHNEPGYFVPVNWKKKTQKQTQWSTFITLLDGNVLHFLYVSKKWCAHTPRSFTCSQLLLFLCISPSLLLILHFYSCAQSRSKAVRAVFRILNPTIDARLLLVCYGATPASSACTGGNPSGRRCACINSKATAARPASILPLCFSSRVPFDAWCHGGLRRSGLDQDLRPWFHLS